MNLPHPTQVRQAIALLETAIQRQLLADLAERDIEALPTPWAPDGLRLIKRLPNGDPLLGSGSLIPQDEGRQWLAHALPTQPGAHLLDFCAGTGAMFATDADAARLARLAPGAEQTRAAITEVPFPPPPDLQALQAVQITTLGEAAGWSTPPAACCAWK